MDYMLQYEDLKDMLCEELEKIVEKGELTAGSLETVHKLTDTIKNVDKITMLEDGEYSEDDGMMMGGGSYRDDGRMSYRNGGQGMNSSRYGGSYARAGRGGMSYRDGGSYGASYRRGRDSRGRFTSRDDATDHLMNKLGEMMEMADDKQREILKRAMRQLETA